MARLIRVMVESVSRWGKPQMCSGSSGFVSGSVEAGPRRCGFGLAAETTLRLLLRRPACAAEGPPAIETFINPATLDMWDIVALVIMALGAAEKADLPARRGALTHTTLVSFRKRAAACSPVHATNTAAQA